MREMVDSGIRWIGVIPNHWSVKKIKNLATEKDSLIIDGDWIESNVIESNGIRYFTTGNIGDGIFKEQGNGYISEGTFTSLGCTRVFGGDLVFSRLNNPMGRSCIIPDGYNNCVVAVDNVIFRPNKDVDKRFVKYVSMCEGYQSENALVARGATMQRMSRTQLVNVFIPICPHNEQKVIADFLDVKCAEIDELISLQEKMIEELRAYKQSVITEAVTKGLNPDTLMKDSGIEWLGEIPEGWMSKRLKFSCKMYGRIGFRGYTADDLVGEKEGAITLSPSNMDGINLDYSKCSYLSWDKYYESPEIMVNDGDVLLVKTASVGKCVYVDKLPMETTVNPQILVLKEHKDNAKFIAYLFQTPIGLFYIDTTKGGSTIYTISQEKIGNYEFVFPPVNEQNEIVKYLDEKCLEIDSLISLKQSKIENLKEYKKSIIYEYVTGKKEVEA